VTGAAPAVLPFEIVSGGAAGSPYALVGQLRSDQGTATGFVVKPRVVATAAHVVFDDGTLSATGTLSAATGLQWLFQRDRGSYEPAPQIPRGYYVFSGYAAQRVREGTPGESSPASQELDAAAVYFLADAGRGGFAGYLASDADENEWLLSPALKTLVGYPVDGVPAANRGRMHATTPADIDFEQASGHTYKTSGLSSAGGNSGGPLCVQFEGGSYYPAAIYLGGTGQTVVRAIDSGLIDLFTRADTSANGGSDNNGGGIVQVNSLLSGSVFASGALRVTLTPTAAVNAGAKWRIGAAQLLASGDTRLNLTPGSYMVSFLPVVGFITPTPLQITVGAGTATKPPAVDYAPLIPAAIAGPGRARAARDVVGPVYQPAVIGTAPVTVAVTVSGGESLATLGLSLNTQTGALSGTPKKVGVYSLAFTATNAAGPSAPLGVLLEIIEPGTLTVAQTAGGSVTPASALGDTLRLPGAHYTLTAKPLTGFLFAGWTGTGAPEAPSASPKLTFTMSTMTELTANFVPNPYPSVSGTYLGLLRSTGDTLGAHGMISTQVSGFGALSGAVVIGSHRYALVGSLDARGNLARTLKVRGLGDLALTLHLDVGSQTLAGMAVVDRVTLALTAHRAVFDAKKNPCPFAGKYTVAFPHQAGTGVPQGDGYGTALVNSGGVVVFNGTLGDGTSIVNLSAKLGQDGQWPFYWLLYRNAGLLAGELQFQLSPANPALAGDLDWLKSGQFATPLPAQGALVGSTPFANLSTATFTISGSPAAPAMPSFPIVFDHTGKATATSVAGFRLQINSGTGLYTGQFLDGHGKARFFGGAFLPTSSEGFGLFKTDDLKTGAVEFHP
jgi:hypothetical protein